MLRLWSLCTLLLVQSCSTGSTDQSILHIESGPVRGFRHTDGTISYRGIPFAAPPTQEHRFRAPQPVEKNWTQPVGFRRDSFQQACPQLDLALGIHRGHEDCLTLDVVVPPGGGTGLPVMQASSRVPSS